MKIIVGKIALVAALTGVTTPLLSVAQNVASQIGTADRSVERLTLLTGPNLLSPPHGAPQSTGKLTIAPPSIKTGAKPAFRFVPTTERFLSGGQESLPLIDRSSFDPLALSGRFTQPPRNAPRPSPESLRFESTLRLPPVRRD